MPHLQWARRSALDLSSAAAVSAGFTRLSADMMRPTGQVLCVESNETAAVLSLLRTEPLAKLQCLGGWKVFSAELLDSSCGNLTNPLRDPQMFVGMYSPAASDESLLAAQLQYHTQAGTRITSFARLRDEEGRLAGVMMLLNAQSNKDGQTYMSLDPMAGSYLGTQLSPVNEQDIDGLNHLMARQFGEKTNLDKVGLPEFDKMHVFSSRHPTPHPPTRLANSSDPLHGPGGPLRRRIRRVDT